MRNKLANVYANIVPVGINDTEIIKQRVGLYLAACDKGQQIATWKGICVALGVPSSTITRWMNANAGHQTCEYLEMIKDIVADKLEQGALNGSLNATTSVFLLKAQHGYKEANEVTINHVRKDVKSFEQLQELVIDVDVE